MAAGYSPGMTTIAFTFPPDSKTTQADIAVEFVPANGDHISLSGEWFFVQRRKIVVNHGTLERVEVVLAPLNKSPKSEVVKLRGV